MTKDEEILHLKNKITAMEDQHFDAIQEWASVHMRVCCIAHNMSEIVTQLGDLKCPELQNEVAKWELLVEETGVECS